MEGDDGASPKHALRLVQFLRLPLSSSFSLDNKSLTKRLPLHLGEQLAVTKETWPILMMREVFISLEDFATHLDNHGK